MESGAIRTEYSVHYWSWQAKLKSGGRKARWVQFGTVSDTSSGLGICMDLQPILDCGWHSNWTTVMEARFPTWLARAANGQQSRRVVNYYPNRCKVSKGEQIESSDWDCQHGFEARVPFPGCQNGRQVTGGQRDYWILLNWVAGRGPRTRRYTVSYI